MKRLTLDEFIVKVRLIHGDKYDYSLVEYKNFNSKIKIICPIHGAFEQTPSNHLSKKGCAACSNNKKIITQIFIDKAKLIHGDKYDYSLAICYNNYMKVKIICPMHGVFEQSYTAHIHQQQKCPQCVGKYKNDKTKEFIIKARLIHRDKYNYDNFVYYGNLIKSEIICSIHGTFEQTPNNHLKGCGCRFCNESKGEKEIVSYLNKLNIVYYRQYKFQDCININPLPFDFYLPDYNLCIEYDGRQHFQNIDFFGGEQGLLENQKRDNIKTQYCIYNNIKLLRIRYNENILNSLIKNIKGE